MIISVWFFLVNNQNQSNPISHSSSSHLIYPLIIHYSTLSDYIFNPPVMSLIRILIILLFITDHMIRKEDN